MAQGRHIFIPYAADRGRVSAIGVCVESFVSRGHHGGLACSHVSVQKIWLSLSVVAFD